MTREPIGFHLIFRLPDRKVWRTDWPQVLSDRVTIERAAATCRREGYEVRICALTPVVEEIGSVPKAERLQTMSHDIAAPDPKGAKTGAR